MWFGPFGIHLAWTLVDHCGPLWLGFYGPRRRGPRMNLYDSIWRGPLWTLVAWIFVDPFGSSSLDFGGPLWLGDMARTPHGPSWTFVAWTLVDPCLLTPQFGLCGPLELGPYGLDLRGPMALGFGWFLPRTLRMENWAPLPRDSTNNKLGSVRHECELQGVMTS